MRFLEHYYLQAWGHCSSLSDLRGCLLPKILGKGKINVVHYLIPSLALKHGPRL